jgi:hypothetical protein
MPPAVDAVKDARLSGQPLRRDNAAAGEAREATVSELLEALRKSREALAERWAELVFASYAPPTARFLGQESDRFRNPVGSTIKAELTELVNGLLSGAETGELVAPLHAIIRVRAVQGFSPAVALSFVFHLKQAVREVLGDSAVWASADELFELHGRLDELALRAFEIYASCREKIFEIRAREATARTYALLKRAGVLEETREVDVPPAGSHPEGRS